MEGVLRWIAKAAQLTSPVVIEGEPGVGKLLAARALHGLSPQRLAPLVVLNAGELRADELVAVLERANQTAPGTVVLRRVENLDPRVQPALVRLLRGREPSRGGGTRVVATSFRSLQQAVKDGTFREDLYFRLSVLPLVIPPLRERKEDIPSLVRFALGTDAQGRPRSLSLVAMERVLAYPWPGNVRELLEVMHEVRERTTAQEVGVELLPELVSRAPSAGASELALHPPPLLIGHGLLPPRLEDIETPSPSGDSSAPSDALFPVSDHLSFKEAKTQLLLAFEKEYLSRLLKRCGGSITKTAQQSGLHRKSIERLVKKYGLRKRRRGA
jgi:DNA-binding NtrC family response regulator